MISNGLDTICEVHTHGPSHTGAMMVLASSFHSRIYIFDIKSEARSREM
jgi:hypothetical protein